MAGMMTGLLLLLLAGVTVGRVLDLQKRIIGGHICADTERLYHVKLRAEYDTQYILCGGTLINEEWILTAAHCVEPGAKRVRAILRVNGKGETNPVDIDMNYIKTHKDNHDIALLKLTNPVTVINPVALPECVKRPIKDGDKVQIAGHGATGQTKQQTKNGLKLVDGPESATLQCAEADVMQQCPGARCPPGDPYHFDRKEMFCFQRALVDIREGDSGGGVMFGNIIYGVQVLSPDDVCTGPTYVMDICKYKTFIETFTGRTFP